MNTISHPSVWLDKKSIDQIRKSALAAEKAKALHPQQLEVIYQNKWMKMYIPKQYGGLDLSLPEILKIEEALSWADGSTAWVVTLCSGAGWFVGFVDPAVAKEFFCGENICIAGSGAATGTAEISETGYTLNGTWKYASGALHATAFTMNCLVQKNGKTIYHADGTPKISSFILKREEVVLHATWNSMGMVATGSHSFEARQVQVSHNRCFTIDPAHAVLNNIIYQYPFLQLAETTLTVNISGLALRFMDLADEIFTEAAVVHNAIGNARQEVIEARDGLNVCRQDFYVAVEKSWAALLADNKIPDALLAKVSESSHQLVQQAREWVNRLYPYCGLKAAATESEINRVWRNIHTAGQHALFSRKV